MMNKICPCGSGKDYQDCCELYISGIKVPTSPEALMRSRYSAYTIANIEYIARTMCDNAIAGFDKEEAVNWAKRVIWQKLEVLNSGLSSKARGFVKFKAYFVENNQQYILHEKSEFRCFDGRWYYVDGVVFE